jgi:multidrug efflux pump subunit AcrA (membrane-fusion protein)
MLSNRILLPILAVGCVPLLTSCRSEAHPVPQDSTALSVEARRPVIVQRPDSVTASGSVEGFETADVAFLVGGRVARVYVEEGQHVSRGQLIAELEPTDYRNALNAAIGQKEAALAEALKAEAGLRRQEVEQARIDLERWDDEYKRMKFLVERQSLPPNDFQKIEAAYNNARQRYDMAVEGTRKEDREAAKAQSHAADANATEEGKRLDDTRLLAPISGNISARRVDPGQTVAAGAAVFSIAELNPVKVRVAVPEAEIAKVKPGAKAEVSIPSLGGRRFEGTVAIMGVAAEPASRTYTVKIIVPNPGPVLLAGMIAESRIFGHSTGRVLTIPGEAITHDAQGAPIVYVYNAERKRVYAHKIDVGAPVGAEMEIRSGVEPADRVVIAGYQKLREGTLVQLSGGAL